jgi:Glutaredoxin-like domain (DUF836)
MGTEPAVTLTVYSRPDCHLCNDMIAGLHRLQARFHFKLTVADVDCDAAIAMRYGNDVPVLVHAGRELGRHVLDEPFITDYLAKIR